MKMLLSLRTTGGADSVTSMKLATTKRDRDMLEACVVRLRMIEAVMQCAEGSWSAAPPEGDLASEFVEKFLNELDANGVWCKPMAKASVVWSMAKARMEPECEDAEEDEDGKKQGCPVDR